MPADVVINRQFDVTAHPATSLVESLRAFFSYKLPTTLVDLVDKSITAGAKSIWVDFHWDGDKSVNLGSFSHKPNFAEGVARDPEKILA